MKVNKPMTIRIGKFSHKLIVGKEAPKVVVDYWKKTKQYDELLKIGAIGEIKETGNNISGIEKDKKDFGKNR